MIAIVNVSKDPQPFGEHTYELRINRKVIATFTHNREETLYTCLTKAAKAARKARRNKQDQRDIELICEYGAQMDLNDHVA